jgi:hypothetical protein
LTRRDRPDLPDLASDQDLHFDCLGPLGQAVAGHPKVIGNAVEESGESSEHAFSQVFPDALKRPCHFQSDKWGFIEAYRHGYVTLHLSLLTMELETPWEMDQYAPVLYRFSGLAGPENAIVLSDETPNELHIKSRDGEHVVLVAVRQLDQLEQGMAGHSLGFHLIRLARTNCLDRRVAQPVKATSFNGAAESFGRRVDRELVVSGRGIPIQLHQFLDDVVERRAQVVNNVSSDGGDLERWLVRHLEAQKAVCGVVWIGLGNERCVRLLTQVQPNFICHSIDVRVGVSEFFNDSGKRVFHG